MSRPAADALRKNRLVCLQQIVGTMPDNPLCRALLGEREAQKYVRVKVVSKGEFAIVDERVVCFT